MPFRRTSLRATKATGFYSPKRSRVVGSRFVGYDADALIYINAVEALDGQSLEDGVKTAYNNFVIGCKTDGIWNSIKSSCILAGARTLSGALTPLVGNSPTNIGFTAASYNRRLGLTGNKSNYLNTNYSGHIANNQHLVIQKTSNNTSNGFFSALAGVTPSDASWVFFRSQSAVAGGRMEYGIGPLGSLFTDTQTVSSFFGVNQSGTSFIARQSANNEVDTATQTPTTVTDFEPFYIFADNNNGSVRMQSDFRIFFYSIGESVDLAKFQARVSGLLVQISGAIP